MRKKRKIDFILYEDKWEKLIFRFYPRQSTCHSFGDEPPKHWGEVYKVYYNYSVLRTWKDENYPEVLFDSSCDECSIIDEVAARIKHIIDGKRIVIVNFMDEEHIIELLDNDMYPMGMGVSWTIRELKNGNYQVEMFNYSEVGYRFFLTKEKLKEFGEYLNECCEYMLTHGDPI